MMSDFHHTTKQLLYELSFVNWPNTRSRIAKFLNKWKDAGYPDLPQKPSCPHCDHEMEFEDVFAREPTTHGMPERSDEEVRFYTDMQADDVATELDDAENPWDVGNLVSIAAKNSINVIDLLEGVNREQVRQGKISEADAAEYTSEWFHTELDRALTMLVNGKVLGVMSPDGFITATRAKKGDK